MTIFKKKQIDTPINFIDNVSIVDSSLKKIDDKLPFSIDEFKKITLYSRAFNPFFLEKYPTFLSILLRPTKITLISSLLFLFISFLIVISFKSFLAILGLFCFSQLYLFYFSKKFLKEDESIYLGHDNSYTYTNLLKSIQVNLPFTEHLKRNVFNVENKSFWLKSLSWYTQTTDKKSLFFNDKNVDIDSIYQTINDNYDSVFTYAFFLSLLSNSDELYLNRIIGDLHDLEH